MKVVCFDLDDTLYKEIDYLKSAYREIVGYAVGHCCGSPDSSMTLGAKAYDTMLVAYQHGENAFESLNTFLGIDLPISEYLQIYRTHKPKISLSKEVVQALNSLKADDCVIGLISDGRSVQQRKKIEALELNQWIANEDIVISEEFGSEKPTLANYEYYMKRYPSCNDFTYVGDNLQKDFIAPNALGWTTICLQDDGRNIHKQNIGTLEVRYHPKLWFDNLKSCVATITE